MELGYQHWADSADLQMLIEELKSKKNKNILL
jgi:hypothetical protein